MKIQRVLSMVTAGLLVLSGAALVACAQPDSSSSADYSGSGRYTFDVHQSGVIADAHVTTDKDGNITDAYLDEWQNPSGWAGSTAGTIIRMKMAGVNTAVNNADGTPNTAARGYTFFWYNSTMSGWVEFAPNASTGVWTLPTTASVPNLDLKMASPLYSQAYADASAAAAADASSTDLATATLDSGGGTANPVFSVVSSAATLVSSIANTKALNKRTVASQYMPMKADSLGYRENYKAMLAFFKANPTANYAGAVKATKVLADLTTDYTNSVANYSQPGGDQVWTVADAVTGATYNDFPNYALGMQTAYLFAIGDKKGGDLRAALIK